MTCTQQQFSRRDRELEYPGGPDLRPLGIARIIEMYGATEGNIALQNLDNRPGSAGKPHAMLEDQMALVGDSATNGLFARALT